MNLYTVEFTFSTSYQIKGETFVSISLAVSAVDQFSALSIAWDRISSLSLPEPKSFSASRLDTCR